MKLHLLVAASALVIGLGMSGSAFATQYGQGGEGGQGGQKDPSTNISGAVAISNQDGAVIGAFAKGTLDNNALTNVSPTGLANIQQNGGANSILQDQNTLGAILDCSCSTSNNSLDVSLAASNQSALVLGAVSIGAQSKADKGTSTGAGFQFVAAGGQESSGGRSSDDKGNSASSSAVAAGPLAGSTASSSAYDNSKHSGGQEASGYLVAASGGWHDNMWNNASSYQASSNVATNIGGTGLINVSQNTGNNSMLQAGNTVAAIVGTSH